MTISLRPSSGRKLIGGVSRAIDIERLEIEAKSTQTSNSSRCCSTSPREATNMLFRQPSSCRSASTWTSFAGLAPGGRATPPPAKAILGVSDGTPFREIVVAAYEPLSAVAAINGTDHFEGAALPGRRHREARESSDFRKSEGKRRPWRSRVRADRFRRVASNLSPCGITATPPSPFRREARWVVH